ncbi:T9SS type A sorting domain-containing protein, partial [bacterium]|nr:T9SS type A sorting domain-containing protein [bacterium]
LIVSSVTFAVTKSEKFARNSELPFYLTSTQRENNPVRDDNDDYMTMRYMFSTDGAETWSDILSAGDHGMWDILTIGEGENMVIDTVQVWGRESYNFGTTVDNSNNLHFFTILDNFNDEYNPYDRENGIYDVKVDAEGNTTYSMIAALYEYEMKFTFADGGKDTEGNLYVIWMAAVLDTLGEEDGVIFASRSTDGGANWSEALTIVDSLDLAHNYPHMTDDVGEYFWILYQMVNEGADRFDHYTIKVAADLSEVGAPVYTGATSDEFFSFSETATSCISQDLIEGHVYFTAFHDYGVNLDIGNISVDGQNWQIENLDVSSYYPNVMLWPDVENGGTPWIFSSRSVFLDEGNNYHKNWFTYDNLGYGGQRWQDITDLDSVEFDGTRSLLFNTAGVLTSEGRLVSGSNVWGHFKPEGYRVKYSDNFGASWSETNELWSIFDEDFPLAGGYIAQNHLLAGLDNHVWVAFCGRYGESDFDGPDIEDVTLSSYMLDGSPWISSAMITDSLGPIEYADINWTMGDTTNLEAVWHNAEFDSAHVDGIGHGMYFFTLPNDSMFGETLEDNDEIWFYIYAEDQSGNINSSFESKIIVGQEFLDVKDLGIMPATIELGQNYPNPFNNSTVLPFFIDRAENINLSVYDINGRLIKTLYNGRIIPGHHKFTWTGYEAAAGVYFSVLEVSRKRYISKMTLVR